MELLVTTPLHIFRVNTTSRRVELVRAGDGYYYGVSCMDQCLVTTHTGGYLRFQKLSGESYQTGLHLIDPHQVEWIGDRVVVANTGNNCLSVFDSKGNLLQHVYLNDTHSDHKDGARIGNHFNSVHRSGDQLLVTAHNYDRPSEIWQLSWPGLEVIGQLMTQAGYAHNSWEGEWGLVTCDSKNGNLYDVTSGKVIWKSGEVGAFPRGLAVSDDHLFVGYSAYAVRKERFWTTGGIWVIDRKTLKLVEKILLPGSGQVHEIRIIGQADAAHNGQVLSPDLVVELRLISPVVAYAYRLRRRYPLFRKDILLISQITRARQIAADRKRNADYQRIQQGPAR